MAGKGPEEPEGPPGGRQRPASKDGPHQTLFDLLPQAHSASHGVAAAELPGTRCVCGAQITRWNVHEHQEHRRQYAPQQQAHGGLFTADDYMAQTPHHARPSPASTISPFQQPYGMQLQAGWFNTMAQAPHAAFVHPVAAYYPNNNMSMMLWSGAAQAQAAHAGAHCPPSPPWQGSGGGAAAAPVKASGWANPAAAPVKAPGWAHPAAAQNRASDKPLYRADGRQHVPQGRVQGISRATGARPPVMGVAEASDFWQGYGSNGRDAMRQGQRALFGGHMAAAQGDHAQAGLSAAAMPQRGYGAREAIPVRPGMDPAGAIATANQVRGLGRGDVATADTRGASGRSGPDQGLTRQNAPQNSNSKGISRPGARGTGKHRAAQEQRAPPTASAAHANEGANVSSQSRDAAQAGAGQIAPIKILKPPHQHGAFPGQPQTKASNGAAVAAGTIVDRLAAETLMRIKGSLREGKGPRSAPQHPELAVADQAGPAAASSSSDQLKLNNAAPDQPATVGPLVQQPDADLTGLRQPESEAPGSIGPTVHGDALPQLEVQAAADGQPEAEVTASHQSQLKSAAMQHAEAGATAPNPSEAGATAVKQSGAETAAPYQPQIEVAAVKQSEADHDAPYQPATEATAPHQSQAAGAASPQSKTDLPAAVQPKAQRTAADQSEAEGAAPSLPANQATAAPPQPSTDVNDLPQQPIININTFDQSDAELAAPCRAAVGEAAVQHQEAEVSGLHQPDTESAAPCQPDIGSAAAHASGLQASASSPVETQVAVHQPDASSIAAQQTEAEMKEEVTASHQSEAQITAPHQSEAEVTAPHQSEAKVTVPHQSETHQSETGDQPTASSDTPDCLFKMPTATDQPESNTFPYTPEAEVFGQQQATALATALEGCDASTVVSASASAPTEPSSALAPADDDVPGTADAAFLVAPEEALLGPPTTNAAVHVPFSGYADCPVMDDVQASGLDVALKAAAPALLAEWECTTCTSDNRGSDDFCFLCGSLRADH